MNVLVDEDALSAHLEDGHTIAVPIGGILAWLMARLDSRVKRANWQISGVGYGIHWPNLDEDIGVEGLLLRRKSNESPALPGSWLQK